MRLGSRVVIIEGSNKGQTGTVMDFTDSLRNIVIGLDNGETHKSNKCELLHIDDISLPNYSIGLKIYSSDIGKIGTIIECNKSTNEDLCTIKWFNDCVSQKNLNINIDYIII